MNWFLLSLTALLFVVGLVVWGVAEVLIIHRRTYARFWRVRREETIGQDAIRLVALGDSTFQGLGASQPMNGTVGRVAKYLEEKTGRAVHIDNVSVTGAKAVDVMRDQLSLVDMTAADVVIVAVGANDALKLSDIHSFERAIEAITSVVPADRTIMADVAFVRDRDAYQTIVERYRKEAKLYRGDLGRAFRTTARFRRQTGNDFFHPSNYGYELWFNGFRPAVDDLIVARSLERPVRKSS